MLQHSDRHVAAESMNQEYPTLAACAVVLAADVVVVVIVEGVTGCAAVNGYVADAAAVSCLH